MKPRTNHCNESERSMTSEIGGATSNVSGRINWTADINLYLRSHRDCEVFDVLCHIEMRWKTRMSSNCAETLPLKFCIGPFPLMFKGGAVPANASIGPGPCSNEPLTFRWSAIAPTRANLAPALAGPIRLKGAITAAALFSHAPEADLPFRRPRPRPSSGLPSPRLPSRSPQPSIG